MGLALGYNLDGFAAAATAAGALSWLLGVLQLGLWLLLLMASAHLLKLGLWALGTRAQRDAAPPCSALEAPVVTVQLPMRNERFVARRAIAAACALQWPRERLQVQVLDDSDDDTVAVVDATVAELQRRGHEVAVVRRPLRTSFKAGHLDYALPSARGEYLAVLDADFVPPPDFLQRLVPELVADPQLAFVQGRWAFLNEDKNLLTRVQALILYGLMLVEQAYLSAHGRPVQFNGSGGIWAKRALLAAGGWVGAGLAAPGAGERGGSAEEAVGGKGASAARPTASVTEDLDLSYRVHLLGYRSRHLPEVAVPTELPATMAAFRSQQQRWVRGGAQVLRSLLLKLRGGTLTARERLTMLGHLLRHARQPYLLLSLLWLPVVALGLLSPAYSPPGGLLGVVLLLHGALFLYYGAALRRAGRSALPALALAPLVVGLSMGLSVSLTVALWRGVFGGRAAAEFVRTPKTGVGPPGAAAGVPASGLPEAPAAAASIRPARAYRPVRDTLARVEVVLGLAYVGLATVALLRGQVLAALGLGALVAAGLLWVGLGSLRSAP